MRGFLILSFLLAALISAAQIHTYELKMEGDQPYLYVDDQKIGLLPEYKRFEQLDFGAGVTGYVELLNMKKQQEPELVLILKYGDQENSDIRTYLEMLPEFDMTSRMTVDQATGLVEIERKSNIRGVLDADFEDGVLYIYDGWGIDTVYEFYSVHAVFPELWQATPIATVLTFLQGLQNGDFQQAYTVEQVKAWGDFDKFLSCKGFGGIDDVFVREVYLKKQTDTEAVVFVSVNYSDTCNIDLDLDEDFILTKRQGSWYITGLKVRRLSRLLSYSDDTGYNWLKIRDFSSKSFDFELVVFRGYDPRAGGPGGMVSGKAVKIAKNTYQFTEGPCKITFRFASDYSSVEVSENGKCQKYRSADCPFSVELDKD